MNLPPKYINSILDEFNEIKYCSFKYNTSFNLENIDEAIVFFSFYVSDGVLNLASLINIINSYLKNQIDLNKLQEILRDVVEKYVKKENMTFPYELSLTEVYYAV